MNKPSTVVIGAGIAGIGAAIRLAAQGHAVDVYEANEHAGGKIFEWRHQGYRFDMGPTVFTMPVILGELFEVAGKKLEDYLTIHRPEVPFHYFFNDGLLLRFFADKDKLIHEIATKTDETEETIMGFLKSIETKYELTNSVFLQNSLHILNNYLSKEALKGLLHFSKVEVFKSMDSSNREKLNDPRAVQLFNSFASYLGSNPYKAPGVLNVISHFQINGGIYLPEGGMQQILNALIRLAEEMGVTFYLGQKVDRIEIENKKATGIRINGRPVYYDHIICNADIHEAYRKLIPEEKKPKRILDHPKSHSVIVFHWGIKQTFPQLALHNMFFAHDMSSEYRTIYMNADVGDDFTCYIYVSNKVNKQDAPEGCENWYILINAPHDQGQDWEAMVHRVRQRLLEKLSIALDENILPHIAFERVQDPRHFARQTRVPLGAIYGNSFDKTFSVFLRHPNFSSAIKNLYFCGGTVHPGSGIPLSILSSGIIANLIRSRNAIKRSTHAI